MAHIRQELVIKFIKVHPDAVIPQAAHTFGDAGYDLYAVEDVLLTAGEATVIRTGLQLADCPLTDNENNSYFLDIRSRSGLSRKMVIPLTGTIDVNYRGEMGIVLGNLGREPYLVKKGDRVAQLVIQQIVADSQTCKVRFVETTELVETERGSGGFGSTGK